MKDTEPTADEKAATGIAGLDSILNGGLPRSGLHLITGPAGAGKTTLALQFLLEGARGGESVLYLTLSQTKQDLEQIAHSHGMALDGVEVAELSFGLDDLSSQEQTIFHASEVEFGEAIETFRGEFQLHRPSRVVFDSVAELSLLAGEPLRHRRQILALRQFLMKEGCTALMISPTRDGPDSDPIIDLVSGAIALDQTTPPHGEILRSLEVLKMRGMSFQTGHHDFLIQTGGLEVFPRLKVEPAVHGGQLPNGGGRELLSSGIEGLDEMLGGGLEIGTSCLIAGPAGGGKSSLAASFANSVARDGLEASIFLFEEQPRLFLDRSRELGFDLGPHVREERVTVRLIESGELSPGEFAHEVMKSADEGAKLVVIDSLTSYYRAMPEQQVLDTQMQELLLNLNQRGVLTILTVGQSGVVGMGLLSPDVSYLADNLIVLRHFESAGNLRKALATVKRRSGHAEQRIRELEFRSGEGITVGVPLDNFQGILSGMPKSVGGRGEDADDV